MADVVTLVEPPPRPELIASSLKGGELGRAPRDALVSGCGTVPSSNDARRPTWTGCKVMVEQRRVESHAKPTSHTQAERLMDKREHVTLWRAKWPKRAMPNRKTEAGEEAIGPTDVYSDTSGGHERSARPCRDSGARRRLFQR